MRNTKTSRSRIETFLYSNPDCPSCRRYDNVRVIFLIASLIIGAYYIYEVRDDMQSQCCTQLMNLTAKLRSQYTHDWDRVNENENNTNNFIYDSDMHSLHD
jgi:hypothetical protein